MELFSIRIQRTFQLVSTYFCSRREFLGGNTPHITELATVAKSLPHSLRKAYK